MSQHRQFCFLAASRIDFAFLRSVGIVPCLIDSPFPELILLSFLGESHFRPAEGDMDWLKSCGIAWEQAVESQLAHGCCPSPATEFIAIPNEITVEQR